MQFVFLLYKIAMAATSVLLGSAARAAECLLIMGAGTGALTAFLGPRNLVKLAISGLL